ncbi:hypothetical protein [uncultured Oscillibacter sp.]|uniref:hypothetical protein n=1 Tax=uncultured Oscillibacter sp. TaxID=876091 RepID=UPI0025F879AE|nr:hypothetical protein [uncultured Oscillibacter sp.]
MKDKRFRSIILLLVLVFMMQLYLLREIKNTRDEFVNLLNYIARKEDIITSKINELSDVKENIQELQEYIQECIPK